MAMKIKAMVFTGPRKIELHEFHKPSIKEDDGLLRIESSGICGSDYEFYYGHMPLTPPVVLGHEPFGTIAEIGKVASEKWGVRAGDRVAVQPQLPCGRCEICMSGFPGVCRLYKPLSIYGHISSEMPPYLWGSMAEYMYLAPQAVVHKVSSDVPAGIAALFNALSAGFEWVSRAAAPRTGDVVAVLGCGQRGLSCVIAARQAGAGMVIVTGLAKDDYKLELAKEFGADVVINVEAEDPTRRVRELTAGRGANVVIDTTANAPEAFNQARRMCIAGGIIVVAGTRGTKPVGVNIDDIVGRGLTIKGVRGVTFEAYKMAISAIESGRYPLEKMHTHSFPIQEAELAIRTLAGEIPGEKPIFVCLVPGNQSHC